VLPKLGHGRWRDFYEVSDKPSLHQPFFPPPTQERGRYTKLQLARALGCEDLTAMLRRCELQTVTRRPASCLFFTLGGAQVGHSASHGWRNVIEPSLESIRVWPFDGDLGELTAPGVTVVEIYPTEAYLHLDVRIGAGTGRSKRKQDDRRNAVAHLPDRFSAPPITLCADAAQQLRQGLASDDDFDAMMGLLSMLLIVTGQRETSVPMVSDIRDIEGWIFGQQVDAF
jgi:hypothetical protein